MMTRAEYIESLRRLNLKVYFMGELIENPVDHPMIRPSMNSVAKTYELAEKPEYQDLMTVFTADRQADQPFLPSPPKHGRFGE